MASFGGEIAAIYRASKKKKDINFWTEWVCRPPAAILVYLLRNTRVTPNQVTFSATILAAVSCALFILLPGYWGAIVATVVFELSFILDCVDGQLARIKKTASTIGHHLDFLMDEIKAFLVFGAVTVRLYRFSLEPYFLIVGIAGMACLGAGLSMTTFMRRAEYGAPPPTEDGQPVVLAQRRGLVGTAIGLLERGARVLVHYPSYILIVALIPYGRLDIYFWAYAGVNVLYAARSFLSIFLKLGRFA
jgi:phosphatidylglycerophosphate synthase